MPEQAPRQRRVPVEECTWMVFIDHSKVPYTVNHFTREEAEAEAVRVATMNIDQRVLVLKVVGAVKAEINLKEEFYAE